MASHPPGQCCAVGHLHDGEPSGKLVKVDDAHSAYLALPDPSKEHSGAAVMIIPDVHGIWKNSQLIADQFAANGFRTIVVDVFNGDAAPLEKPANWKLWDWISHGSDGQNPHTEKAIDPIMEAAIKYLREAHGAKRIGAVGYCFGAKYVVRHFKSGIDVGYMAHPSWVDEDELASITGPLAISAAETDTIFTAEKRHKSELLLQKAGNPYQIYLFSGVSHGFAVRGDISNKAIKFAKEQAFRQAVAWFEQWLA